MGSAMACDSRIGDRYSLGMDEGEQGSEEGKEDAQHGVEWVLCADLDSAHHRLVRRRAVLRQCVCSCT